jgi:hypothetical protein
VRRALALIACCSAACTFDAAIPEGALVRCGGEGECPQGYACQRGLSRCVPEAELDLAVPEVVGLAALTLVPDRQNPLATPTAMTRGTLARVSFQVSEPLAEPPTLVACPQELGCAFESAAGLVQVFVCSFREDPPPLVTKPCPATVELVDLAQQRFTSPLTFEPPGLRLDTEAPRAPAVDVPDAVTYSRAPWGAEETVGLPRAQVQGAVGAVAEASLVLVQERAGRELARGPTAGDGSFAPVVLGQADLPQVWVAAVDEAGNASASVSVRDVEWTATLGFKTSRADNLNPHRFFERPAHSASLRPAVPGERYASDGVAAREGARLTTAGSWVWHARADTTQSDFPGTSVYDSARARVVSFGGEVSIFAFFGGAIFPSDQLIEWNGEDWVVLSPRTRPEARRRHAIAYHVGLEQTVVFGGEGWSGPLADTWTWDGTTWVQLRTQTSPSGGALSAMAYDARREKAVLFSGAAGGQTWEFDGEWTLRSGLDAGPTPRVEHVMAWDPTRATTLLFGGRRLLPDGGTGAAVGDFWEFDGASWTQLPRTDGGAWPPANTRDGALVADPGRGTVLLQVPGGMWEWNQSSWRQVPELTDVPSSPQTLLAHDLARDQTLLFRKSCFSLFGFVTCEPPETHGWNGVSRTVLRGTGTTRGTQLAFDPSRGGVVSVSADAGTQLWNGARWQVLSDAGQSPAARLSYDRDAGELLAWQPGAATQVLGPDAGWVTLPAVLPADAGFAAAVYDERLGGLLVLGGATQPHAWLWQNGQWVDRVDLALPGAAPSLSATFDAARGRAVVAAQDSTRAADLPWHALFELVDVDGGFQWRATGATSSGDGGWVHDPAFEFQTEVPLLAHDHERQRLIRFGLRGAFPVSGRTVLREWTAAGWQPAQVYDAEGQGAPDFTFFVPGMVFDPLRGRTVLLRDATHWELESARRHPSHVFEVALGAAGLPRDSVVSVTANAVAGGTAMDGGAVLDGAQLAFWREGLWVPAAGSGASNQSGPQLPGPITATVVATELERVLRGGRAVSVAIFPRGVNGSGTAEVTTDYVELKVRFRLAPAIP